VSITSKTVGVSSNFPLSVASQSSNSAQFSPPSFSGSARSNLAGGTGGYSFSLTFAPDGDILAASDSVNGNWAYTYDAFNRLLGANQNSGAAVYSYAYDRFGNRWQQNGPSSMQLAFDTNNRIATYCQGQSGPAYTYDAAGNLTYDCNHTYTYDAENRLYQVLTSGTVIATYVYDANGRRVRKTASGVTTDYIYNLSGNYVAQVSNSGAWTVAEVYAGGMHLATYSGGASGTTVFNHADWLGTERARTSTTGTLSESCTSLPFGDALSCTGSDTSGLHFTGKERDTESGLDNFKARYDSSSMGRFMSPDPLNTLDLSHPQKLNRYTYANNNPLSNVDVGGHCTAPAVSGGQVGICVESYIRTRFLPGKLNHLALALGDDRGPNPHGGSFRTQTLLTVDPSSHAVSIVSHPPGESCAIRGCYPGVNTSSLSKITHDDKGNTYFTLSVTGENGYEAQGKWFAPSGLIQMEFSFKVDSKGNVTLLSKETKGYPSVSIYSYDSEGDDQDLFQQTESGHIEDLEGPMKSANNQQPDPVEQDMQEQCREGNPAACNFH
jgi:RHS repeat-associated protein